MESEFEASHESGEMSSKAINIGDEEEIRQVFNQFDQDRNGVITVEEVRNYMSRLKFDLSETETENLMKGVDRNNDGTVDFEEFYSLYQNIRNVDLDEEEKEENDEEDEDEVLQAFRVFDANEDGFITAQELQAIFKQLGFSEGKNLKACQNMIDQVTQNGSGKVDLKQFRQMMAAKEP